MKLINPLKINKSVNFYILIILITRCIACIFFMAMLGTILGRRIVFSKTQVLFFDWRAYIIYSLKVGGGAGMLAGIGIWIKAKLQERKDDKK